MFLYGGVCKATVGKDHGWQKWHLIKFIAHEADEAHAISIFHLTCGAYLMVPFGKKLVL